MGPTGADQLRLAVSKLDELIALAQARGLGQTAQLLNAAKLNLLMDIHQVSDMELREFCRALETGPDGSGNPMVSSTAGDLSADANPLGEPLDLLAAKLRRSRSK